MSVKACMAGKLGEESRELSDEEYEAIIDALEGRRADWMGLGDDDARLKDAAARAADRLRVDAAVGRRNAMLTVLVHKRAHQIIGAFALGKSSADKEPIPGLPAKGQKRAPGGKADADGFRAWLGSSNQRSPLARVSFNTEHLARLNKYVDGLVGELVETGTYEALMGRRVLGVQFGPGFLDRQIARELWELNTKNGKPGASKSPEALAAAKVIGKYLEMARRDQNLHGSWIGSLRGFIARQTHDMAKLKAGGYEAWRDFLMNGPKGPRLDVRRTFYDPTDRGPTPSQVEKYLEGIFAELSQGRTPDVLNARQSANVGKKISQGRVLHFVGSDAWMDYNERFGYGALMDAVFGTLDRSARNTALLSHFGPNPRAMFERVRRDLIVLNPGNRRELEAKSLDWLMDAADATDMDIGSVAGAHIGTVVRNVERMSSLGSMIFASLPDPLVQASRLEFNGANAFEAVQDQLVGMVGGRKDVAAAIDFGLETLTRDIAGRFEMGDDAAGLSGKMTNLFFKATSANWWETRRLRAFVAGMSRLYYEARGTAYGELHPEMRATLSAHGIGTQDWNVIRKHGAFDLGDGKGVISGEGMRRIPDSEILDLIGKRESSGSILDLERDRLETLVRGLYADEVSSALLRPGVTERARAYRGNARGTWAGEAIRAFFLFKQYPMQYAQRVIGSFVQEDSFGAIAKEVGRGFGGALTGRGVNMRAARLIASSIVVGYMSLVLKDLIKNRTPRDPRDPRTWAAAFMQGGGVGVYSDFLFGISSRFGSSTLGTLGGPVAGDLELTGKVVANLLAGTYDAIEDGDWGKLKVAGDSAFRLVKENTPFVNAWYARGALDFFVWSHLAELMNPGYLRREEERMLRENDQEFIVSPVETFAY